MYGRSAGEQEGESRRYGVRFGVVAAVAFALPSTVQAQVLTTTSTATPPIDDHRLGRMGGLGGTSTERHRGHHIPHSSPNSLAVSGGCDGGSSAASTAGCGAGLTYVPSTQTGDMFFILLNTYTHAGTNNNWSAQIALCNSACGNGTAGMVASLGGSDVAGTETTPLLTDQWVELIAEINLGELVQRTNGAMFVSTATWTVSMQDQRGPVLTSAASPTWTMPGSIRTGR
jgi:hypothetical protein